MRDLTREENDKIGGFNDPIPNLKEITEGEFWSRFLTWNFISREYRQVTKDVPGGPHRKGGKMEPYTLLVQKIGPAGPEGLAILQGVENARAVPKRFFTFTCCDHRWSTPTNPKGWACYREYTCTRCGLKEAIDSSD